MKLTLTALAGLLALLPLPILAQTPPPPAPPPLTYTTSWIGNSFGGEVVPGLPFHKHVQISADDVFVAPDGTVYTDTGWDENGCEAGFYRDGDVRGALEELSHGWGRAGGGAVTANGKYVFAAMSQSGDDGANKNLNKNGLRQYPDPKNLWYAVRRFTRDGCAVPFPTGLGWKNDMVVVNAVAQDAPGHYADQSVQGLAADAQHLYVSDPAHGQIRVYDAETLAPLVPLMCARPGKLALGFGGRLWVLEAGGGSGRRVLCLDAQIGKVLPSAITGTPGWDPQGIAADKLGHVFVADSGPDQDVKIYAIHTSLRSRTTLTTFGVKGGIFTTPVGTPGPRRYRDNLGGFNAGGDAAVQEWNSDGTWSSPAYWNGAIYYQGSGGTLKRFPIAGGVVDTANVIGSGDKSGFPGSTPILSSNGTTNGIVWTIQSDAYNNSGGQAVLHAHDALNPATELYNTSQLAARDNPGIACKFTLPVVTNGKVYVGTQNQISAYGLNPPALCAAPVITASGQGYVGDQVTITDATPTASLYYTTDGTDPTTASAVYIAPFVANGCETIKAKAFATGYLDSAISSRFFGMQGTAGHGTGLAVTFFTGTNLDPAAGPTVSRTDPTIDFRNWTPDPSLGASNFSARWTGQVQPKFTDTYTFTTVSDDGIRIWVNGQELINDWSNHGATTDTGTIALQGGQRYDLRVEYFQGGGGSDAHLSWASACQGSQIIPTSQLYVGAPDAPAGLTATPGDAKVALSWTASPGASSYVVKRGTADGGPYTALTPAPSGPSYTDTGVTNGTTYYYVVDAVNTAGPSGDSGQASATPAAGITPVLTSVAVSPPTAALSTGGTKTFTAVANDQFGQPLTSQPVFAWTVDAGGVGGVDANGNYAAGTSAGTATVRAASGLVSGTASVTVTAPSGPPTAPTGLGATAVSPSEIDLAWTNTDNTQTSLKLERSTDGGTTFAPFQTLAANATGYADTGLTPATAYVYRIKSSNARGDSLPSLTATATTLDVPPTQASNLVATAISLAEIDLTFQDNSNNETGFHLYRKTGTGGTFALVATIPASPGVGATVSYADTGLTTDTYYEYHLKAFNAVGEGADFSGAHATTLPPPATGLAVASVTGAYGQTVTLTATLTQIGSGAPIPGGTVAFSVNGVRLGTAITGPAGIASQSYVVSNGLVLGAHSVIASVAANGSYLAASGVGLLSVVKAATSLALPAASAVRGTTVTLKATLRRATDGVFMANRVVTFRVDGKAAGMAVTNASGVASRSYTVLTGASVGSHPVSAGYAGDSTTLVGTGSGALTVR